jgi:hypothetical protein
MVQINMDFPVLQLQLDTFNKPRCTDPKDLPVQVALTSTRFPRGTQSVFTRKSETSAGPGRRVGVRKKYRTEWIRSSQFQKELAYE